MQINAFIKFSPEVYMRSNKEVDRIPSKQTVLFTVGARSHVKAALLVFTWLVSGNLPRMLYGTPMTDRLRKT